MFIQEFLPSAYDGRLYSFRFAVSDSHSDSNMKIDQCLAYKMSNYSVSFYAMKLLMNFHSSPEHCAFNQCILKALAQHVKSGKIGTRCVHVGSLHCC